MKRKKYKKPLDLTWNPSRILLFDGNNIAWKALYGGDVLSNPKTGELTSMLYRFLRTVYMVLNRFPRYVPIVVWDHGKSKLRTEYDPTYKAQRREKRIEASAKSGRYEEAIDWHEEFSRQQKLLRQRGLPLLGIPQFDFEGVEADDIIYFLCQYYLKKRNLVAVCSSDKDMYQCVGKGVQVFDHTSKTVVNRKTFKHVTGFTKHQFLLYRAMTGDPSDNIKGIKGVGPKTASKVLAEIPFISTPHRFMQADLTTNIGLNLQARLADDSTALRQFKRSWTLQSLYYWHRKHYLKQLGGVGTPLKCVRQVLKMDEEEFNTWALRQGMKNLVYGDSPIAMLMQNRRAYWMYFFKKHKVLKKIPKELR